MKKLREFLVFNLDSFFEGKDIRVLASEPWKDYGSESGLDIVGTKYKAIILADNTSYKNDKDNGNNTGEPLSIKVAGPAKPFKKLSKFKLIGAEATVYGEYSNLLSIKSKDIEFFEK